MQSITNREGTMSTTTYSDASAGTLSMHLARAMHAESVDLWNRLSCEASETGQPDCMDFPEREDVETLQRILTKLAWPT